MILDQLSVSADICWKISVYRNIGKIPYRCITVTTFAPACHSLTVQPHDDPTTWRSDTLSHTVFGNVYMYHVSPFFSLPPSSETEVFRFNTSSLLENVRLAFVCYDHAYLSNNNYWNMAIKIILFWQFDRSCGLLLGHPGKLGRKCLMSDRYFIHCMILIRL